MHNTAMVWIAIIRLILHLVDAVDIHSNMNDAKNCWRSSSMVFGRVDAGVYCVAENTVMLICRIVLSAMARNANHQRVSTELN